MANVSEKYLALIRSFPLRPIRAEAELDKAIAVMHQLTDATKVTAPEADYLLVLGNLIEEYESKNHTVEDLAPQRAAGGRDGSEGSEADRGFEGDRDSGVNDLRAAFSEERLQ